MCSRIYCLDLDFSLLEQEGVIKIFHDKTYIANVLLSLLVPRADITNQLLHSSTLSSDLDTALYTIVN